MIKKRHRVAVVGAPLSKNVRAKLLGIGVICVVASSDPSPIDRMSAHALPKLRSAPEFVEPYYRRFEKRKWR